MYSQCWSLPHHVEVSNPFHYPSCFMLQTFPVFRNFINNRRIVLFSPCQDTHCEVLHKHLQMISVQSNFCEVTPVMLMNISCLRLHGYFRIAVNSCLVTGVTLIQVSGGRLGECLNGSGPSSELICLL